MLCQSVMRCLEEASSLIAGFLVEATGSALDAAASGATSSAAAEQARSLIVRICTVAAGMLCSSDTDTGAAAVDALVSLGAASVEASSGYTPLAGSASSSATAVEGAVSSSPGKCGDAGVAVLSAIRDAVTSAVAADSSASGSLEGVSSARATELLARIAGSHPSAIGVYASGEAGWLQTFTLSVSERAAAVDPLACFSAMSQLPLLLGSTAGAGFLRRSGITQTLAEMAGWPVSDASSLARPSPALQAVLLSAGPRAETQAEPAAAGQAADAPIAVPEADPVLGAAAAQVLAGLFARTMRLAHRGGAAGFGAAEEAAALRDAGLGEGAVVSAMAAADGHAGAGDEEAAVAAGVCCVALAADAALLRRVLVARGAGEGGASAMERALARARTAVLVDGFHSRSDAVRRAARLGISQVLRAASVAPADEPRGRGAVAAARWALGMRELPEHLRGMPEEEVAARDASSAAAAGATIALGAQGATGGGSTSPSSSAPASSSTAGTGASGADSAAVCVQEALWATLGGPMAAVALLKSVKSAVWEDKEAALAVCEALAGQPSGWGLAAMRSAAGLLETCIAVDPADEPGAIDVRKAVAEAAMRCLALEASLGPTLAAAVRKAASGARVVVTEAASVATEVSN